MILNDLNTITQLLAFAAAAAFFAYKLVDGWGDSPQCPRRQLGGVATAVVGDIEDSPRADGRGGQSPMSTPAVGWVCGGRCRGH